MLPLNSVPGTKASVPASQEIDPLNADCVAYDGMGDITGTYVRGAGGWVSGEVSETLQRV